MGVTDGMCASRRRACCGGARDAAGGTCAQRSAARLPAGCLRSPATHRSAARAVAWPAAAWDLTECRPGAAVRPRVDFRRARARAAAHELGDSLPARCRRRRPRLARQLLPAASTSHWLPLGGQLTPADAIAAALDTDRHLGGAVNELSRPQPLLRRSAPRQLVQRRTRPLVPRSGGLPRTCGPVSRWKPSGSGIRKQINGKRIRQSFDGDNARLQGADGARRRQIAVSPPVNSACSCFQAEWPIRILCHSSC